VVVVVVLAVFVFLRITKMRISLAFGRQGSAVVGAFIRYVDIATLQKSLATDAAANSKRH